jgi:hypothetical protein
METTKTMRTTTTWFAVGMLAALSAGFLGSPAANAG